MEESGQEAALKCVSFVFNDRAYRFEFEENQNLSLEGQSKLGKVRLYEKDELVISIGVVLDVNGEIDDWRYVNVDALKPGVWVGDIVLLEQQIELEQEKLIGSFEARELLERAKNLPKPPS